MRSHGGWMKAPTTLASIKFLVKQEPGHDW
jgi:hypothetical protein